MFSVVMPKPQAPAKFIVWQFLILTAFAISNHNDSHLTEADMEIGACPETMRQLFMVHRHGAKVPLSMKYIREENKAKFKGAPGQLTKEGKIMLYRMGIEFQRRYGKFIGEQYNSFTFRQGSTQMDRTIISAMSFSMGLFLPTDVKQFRKDNFMQLPVPIYPLSFSSLGAVEESMASMYQNMNVTCKSLMQMLSGKEKKTLKTILLVVSNGRIDFQKVLSCEDTSFLRMLAMIDDLSTQIWYNMTLPSEFEGMEREIEEIKSGLFLQFFFQSFFSGELFKSILETIENYNTGKATFTTVIFSEHDANVGAAVMQLTGQRDIMYPSFGANLVVEIHNAYQQSDQRQSEIPTRCQHLADPNDAIVKAWYAYEGYQPPRRLAFKTNRKNTMTLTEFVKFLKRTIPSYSTNPLRLPAFPGVNVIV